MIKKNYFKDKKSIPAMLISGFLILLFVFSVVFFIKSVMDTNEINKEVELQEQKIEKLTDEIEQYKYLIDAPLDEDYKMRIAREKLGMCFPDEIIFHTGRE